jgi:ribosomal-protein-alanine N-acetyltransferase
LLDRLFEREGIYFLEVRESNRPAQELYSRFGFQAVGKRPKYYRRPMESAIVMKMKRVLTVE